MILVTKSCAPTSTSEDSTGEFQHKATPNYRIGKIFTENLKTTLNRDHLVTAHGF